MNYVRIDIPGVSYLIKFHKLARSDSVYFEISEFDEISLSNIFDISRYFGSSDVIFEPREKDDGDGDRSSYIKITVRNIVKNMPMFVAVRSRSRVRR